MEYVATVAEAQARLNRAVQERNALR